MKRIPMKAKRDSWCRALCVGTLFALTLNGSTQAQCAADLDQDGVVGVFDLLIFLPCWVETDDNPACDINSDGIVNGVDAGLLIAHWGKCAEDLEQHTAPLVFAIDEITDPVTAAQGLREFDVFVQFETTEDLLLTVFDANITCNCANGFIHAPVEDTGVSPLWEWMWDSYELTFDSYITIGAQFGPDGGGPDQGFDEAGFLEGGVIGQDAGWLTLTNTDGLSGNYANNQVRVATFTTEFNTTIEGELSILYVDSDNHVVFATDSFFISAIIGDINSDGIVGTSDLLLLLSNWGLCDDCQACPSDLDYDCQVGTSDLLALFANWG